MGNLVTESMLADVIDNLTGAILLVNRDRRVILANKMTEKMTGQPQTALQGRRGGEVLGCVNAARSPGGCGFDARCTFCGIKRMVEETFAHKAANTFLSAEVASTLFGRRDLRVSTKYLIVDNAEAVLISMEDVTREKTEERLRMENAQLVAAMETAGAVCHELNQPLTVISGYVQLLLSDRMEIELACDHLQKIKTEIDRIQRITRKLMKINVYRTKAYAGVSRILDLDGSSADRSVENATTGHATNNSDA